MRLLALSLCVFVAVPVAASAQNLPAGPGGEIVAKSCQTCHGLDEITNTHHDIEGWRATIAQMIGNGASVTDAEAEDAAKYLSTNFGLAPAPAETPAAASAAPAEGAAASPAAAPAASAQPAP